MALPYACPSPGIHDRVKVQRSREITTDKSIMDQLRRVLVQQQLYCGGNPFLNLEFKLEPTQQKFKHSSEDPTLRRGRGSERQSESPPPKKHTAYNTQ